jgi:hypothetical protein
VDAFVSKTVPIYFGNPKISKEFNSESYIDVSAFNSFKEAVYLAIDIFKSRMMYQEITAKPLKSK